MLLIATNKSANEDFPSNEPFGTNINDGVAGEFSPEALDRLEAEAKADPSKVCANSLMKPALFMSSMSPLAAAGIAMTNPPVHKVVPPKPPGTSMNIQESVYKGIKTIDVPHVDTTDESLSRGSLIRKRYWGRY